MGDKLFKEETLSEKLIKKGFWLYLFTFLIAPSGYIIRVILSNNLSISDVGLIYSIISFVVLISVYNDVGLTGSLKYFLPKFWLEKKYSEFKTTILLTILVQLSTGIIITVLLYYGSDYLAKNYFHTPDAGNILRIFCFYFLGINLYQVITKIFLSFQDVFNNKLVEFIRMWTVAGGTLLLFFTNNNNVLNYSFVWITGLFTALFFSIYIFYKKYFYIFEKGKIKFNKKILKKIFGYAIWMFLSMNAGFILGQIDQQMIVYFLGTRDAGIYSNYLSLLVMGNVILLPLIGLLFPILRESITKKDGKVKLIQNFFYKYFSLFSLSFGLFLFVLGPVISTTLFGAKFSESGMLLIYSGLFLPINILLTINLSITGALGKVKENTKIIVSVAILNVILNYYLIQTIGIKGAIISTIVGRILMWYFTFRIVNKNITLTFNWFFFIKNVLFFCILGVLLFTISNSIFIIDDLNRYTNLLNLLGLGVLYYLFIAIYNYKDLIIFRKEILSLKKK